MDGKLAVANVRFSILSAVHNEAMYLSTMIASLQSQNVHDWEVLFVSDGSTDDTQKIIEAAAAQDPRIKLVGDGSKVGKVPAFNQAYAASTGELVVLLAGDDSLPSTSLQVRSAELADVDPYNDDVVAFFKLRTISTQRGRDGLVLPRGDGASHSGGTITLTRHLARQVFPIDSSLISEDLWLTRASEGLAREVREFSDVVLNYRIHSRNSNPRAKSFAEMSKSMGARHRAWEVLLAEPRFQLRSDLRDQLVTLAALEELRRRRRVLALLRFNGASVVDRAAFAAMASPILFWLRKRVFRLVSGRRAR